MPALPETTPSPRCFAARETPAGAERREATYDVDLLVGTVLGHYRIDGVLGRGGMGIVYRGTDTKLGRPVAIKFLAVTVPDADAKRRFQREAQTTSALNHPHIVTVYDVGEHEGRPFIVSELVDGGTLENWCTRSRRRDWRQSVELLIGVADGLAAAHAADVLHRDVKPANILIDGNGYAKLADFGLAKLVGAPAESAPSPRTGVVVGTVAYMSPEQAACRRRFISCGRLRRRFRRCACSCPRPGTSSPVSRSRPTVDRLRTRPIQAESGESGSGRSTPTHASCPARSSRRVFSGFDVTPDGQRFLVSEPVPAEASSDARDANAAAAASQLETINVSVNWRAGLGAR